MQPNSILNETPVMNVDALCVNWPGTGFLQSGRAETCGCLAPQPTLFTIIWEYFFTVAVTVLITINKLK